MVLDGCIDGCVVLFHSCANSCRGGVALERRLSFSTTDPLRCARVCPMPSQRTMLSITWLSNLSRPPTTDRGTFNGNSIHFCFVQMLPTPSTKTSNVVTRAL